MPESPQRYGVHGAPAGSRPLTAALRWPTAARREWLAGRITEVRAAAGCRFGTKREWPSLAMRAGSRGRTKTTVPHSTRMNRGPLRKQRQARVAAFLSFFLAARRPTPPFLNRTFRVNRHLLSPLGTRPTRPPRPVMDPRVVPLRRVSSGAGPTALYDCICNVVSVTTEAQPVSTRVCPWPCT